MKKLQQFFLVGAVVIFPHLVRADDTWVYAVQISAVVQTNPPRITLSWEPDPYGVNSYSLYRKAKEATNWGAGIALDGAATNYTDTNVVVGGTYEYQIVKAATLGYTGYGYIYSGINAALTENRGKLILIVETNATAGLSNELSRLQSDLTGDGWLVIRHGVSSNDPPGYVKGLITNDYYADPANVKTVFLFGNVTNFPSGNLNYDGHQVRPMPADAYFGDVDGDWSTNPDYLPSDVELMVGRVDLFNMPGAGANPAWPSETEMLRTYLDKDHNWRHKLLTVPRLALMGDRRGIEPDGQTAACGYRNFEPLVGPGNTIQANIQDDAPIPDRWSPMLASGAYLWAYGCGGGEPAGITFLGTNGQYNESWSTDIVGEDAHAVFVMLFGSWFGNWDRTDNYLRAFLATPTMGLAACMAGRPHWFVHHMGLGETIGYGTRLSMNNSTLYQSDTNPLARAVYTALMGDPTLRQDLVAPPAAFTALRNNGNNVLNWSPSPDPVRGYHIYRGPSPAGPFSRLTTSLVNGTSFIDTNIPPYAYTYMVRAVGLQTTPSGTYFNPSQGLFASVDGIPLIQVLAARSTNGLVITWNSQPGNVYEVLASGSLTQSNWVNASGAVTATGPTTSWVDANFHSYPLRFYRVALIPQTTIASNPAPNGIQARAGVSNAGFVITWNSQPGIVYEVLGTGNLTQPNWNDLSGNITASGNLTSWTDTAAPALPQRFYKVAAVTQVPVWMNPTLSSEQRANLLLTDMTLDEKIDMLHGVPGPYVGNTTNISRLGIPGLHLQDGPAGIADGAQDVTALPAPILVAASWDTALARQYGAVEGTEARAKGVHVLLGPMMNMIRVPQGGRAFETFGEDPFLTASIAAADILGIQAQGVIACAKHFIANDQETTRGNANSQVDERTLEELYELPFLGAVRAGVGSICSAYNAINGDWSSESPLLNSVLKINWGFQGFVMCDWGANFSMQGAVSNGLDLEMPADLRFGSPLESAIQSSNIPVALLDDKVRRILSTMFRAGIFDNPSTGTLSSVAFTAQHAQFARDTAAGGIVLLQNQRGLLPLNSTALHTIAVSGSAAFENPIWTGRGSAQVFFFPYYVTPLDGISNRAGAGISIAYAAGDTGDPTNITLAVQQAQQSDVAIVCVGEQTGEGADRSSLSLPANQDALVSAVAAVNTNTIVVLYEGAGTLMPWATNVAAIVVAWYPGLEGANALASILFGDVNPSGKLPVTFPAASNQVPANTPAQFPGTNLQVIYSEGLEMGYRWYDSSSIAPLFPFGHGLSYTKFAYSNLTVGAVSPSGQVKIAFDLFNTGNRAGAEVAQLYLGFPSAAGEPPRQLKGFQKVTLAPGGTNHVIWNLDWDNLAYWDTNAHAWTVPQGTFQVAVGASSRDIRLTNSFAISSPIPASDMANLALFQPVSVSSVADTISPGAAVVDGDPSTGWSSLPGNPQWITVDLGSIQQVNRVRLKWDANYAYNYLIRISNDNSTWTTLYSTSTGAGGFEDLLVSGSGRYIQVYAQQSATGLGYSLDEFEVYSFPGASGSVSDTVWIDDTLPAGASGQADGGDGWTWVSSNPAPFSGTLANQSNLTNNLHEHYFTGGSPALPVNTNDTLFAYVYLDPANVPLEVMLQWNDGSWEHRAYWGENDILYGVTDTSSRRYMGPLPAAGQWVKLSVPANQVALEGSAINGLSFSLFGGRATWDYAGKTGL